jgi:hypothetical protein
MSGTTVDVAIAASDEGMAERLNPRNQYLLAKRCAGGIRIVKSYTDPTVVRKLRSNELLSRDWFPLNARQA